MLSRLKQKIPCLPSSERLEHCLDILCFPSPCWVNYAPRRDEQKAREAVLNNPFQLKRARELAMAKAHSKKLKKALKKEKKREKKEKKKEKKERKRDSHRSDDEDHRRSHGRGRSRSRSRSRSHRRSRSPLRRARASSSPRRHRRRSPSPRRVDRHRSPPVRRGDVRSRSPRRSTQRHARPSKQSAEEREAKLREMMVGRLLVMVLLRMAERLLPVYSKQPRSTKRTVASAFFEEKKSSLGKEILMGLKIVHQSLSAT